MRALALLLVACSSPAAPARPQPDTTPTAPTAPTEVTVTDVASAQRASGHAASVTGVAGNAKVGAVVVLPDRTPVYCQPLERWPDDVEQRPVTAHGRLEQTDEYSAPAGATGTSGAVWVLRDCTYDPPSP